MVLYRWDVQKRVVTDLVATGVYYWTNVHYVEAVDFTEFDLARDSVLFNEKHSHRAQILFDRWKCTRLSDGAVVQNSAMSGTGFVPGSGQGIVTNTIIQWLRYSDGKLGYKRWRMPLHSDESEGGRLTPAFVAFWHANCPDNWDTDWLWHRSSTGATVVETWLDPYAHGWQLRHGTRRSERRRIV